MLVPKRVNIKWLIDQCTALHWHFLFMELISKKFDELIIIVFGIVIFFLHFDADTQKYMKMFALIKFGPEALSIADSKENAESKLHDC